MKKKVLTMLLLASLCLTACGAKKGKDVTSETETMTESETTTETDTESESDTETEVDTQTEVETEDTESDSEAAVDPVNSSDNTTANASSETSTASNNSTGNSSTNNNSTSNNTSTGSSDSTSSNSGSTTTQTPQNPYANNPNAACNYNAAKVGAETPSDTSNWTEYDINSSATLEVEALNRDKNYSSSITCPYTLGAWTTRRYYTTELEYVVIPGYYVTTETMHDWLERDFEEKERTYDMNAYIGTYSNGNVWFCYFF